jgi:ArsR family transcriptional regulator
VGLHKADVGELPFDDGALDASILSLILHHLDSPGIALNEAGRITSGPILVIDMMSHERTDYRDTMGHLHLGFTAEELETLADGAGLMMQRYIALSPDPEASGPPLFVARLVRR